MITNYVDIHSHILPEVDDGARSLEESTDMLKQAYGEGVRTMIATPHYGMQNYEINQAVCEEKVEELNAIIRMDGELEGMKVVLGNELLYHTGVSDEVRNGQAKTLGTSNFVLVEFYEAADYTVLEACAREMAMAGYRPIFAHVERYVCLRDSLDKIDALRNEGVLVQVNAGELLEDPKEENEEKTRRGFKLFGGPHRNTWEVEIEERRRFAWQALLSGKVDFIASDAHRKDVRTPVMESAMRKIREVAGDKIADEIAFNAQIIG